MLMQHYHTPTNLSRKLDASIRYLQLQLGHNKNSSHLDYNTWGHLALISWAKMMWRSLQYYQVRINMKYKEIPYPREIDKVVMDIIVAAGLTRVEICSLNRCRCFLRAIFLSDMATADGKYIKQFFLDPQENSTKSKYKFPREEPTKTDWTWWTKFWLNCTATGKRLQTDLGK